MKFNGALVTILFVLSLLARSEENVEASKTEPWNKGIVSSINLGVRYSSSINKRGATMYDYFQIDPVLGVFLFNDRLEYLGDSIGYRDFVYSNVLRARTRIAAISDDPLFPKQKSRISKTNSRLNSYESISSLEFFIPRYDQTYLGEIDFNVSQDIATHHGQYAELVARAKLFHFREPLGNTFIEPNAVFTLGWGSKSHNSFFYGDNAKYQGLNNFAAGLQLALPDSADRFYPIVLLQYYSTLGQARRGDLLMEKTSGVMLQFIATVGILD